jgi:netrin-G3 ligand
MSFYLERQIPPYFSIKLPHLHKVVTGGTVNLTCVAVGYPMPRVFWRRQSDGLILNDPLTAPIGRNILTVRDVRQSETYKCLAVSKLGNIGAITVIEPDGRKYYFYDMVLKSF